MNENQKTLRTAGEVYEENGIVWKCRTRSREEYLATFSFPRCVGKNRVRFQRFYRNMSIREKIKTRLLHEEVP